MHNIFMQGSNINLVYSRHLKNSTRFVHCAPSQVFWQHRNLDMKFMALPSSTHFKCFILQMSKNARSFSTFVRILMKISTGIGCGIYVILLISCEITIMQRLIAPLLDVFSGEILICTGFAHSVDLLES